MEGLKIGIRILTRINQGNDLNIIHLNSMFNFDCFYYSYRELHCHN